MPPVDARVSVPGSKSIANRALVCAALADGTSTLTNLPDGDDTTAMLECLRALGLAVDGAAPSATIAGSPGLAAPSGTTAFAGLAGTTSRFVTALAALSPVAVTIDGYPPLRARPFGPLHDALSQLGVTVTPGDTVGGLPVRVQGPPTGSLVSLPGDVSSQFVSALMMIGPRLPAGLQLDLTTELVSRPYVELTTDVMGWFGIDGVTVGERSISVPVGLYRAADVFVEPDASSASYPLAVAAVAGGRVTVAGLGTASRQGDARFADLLALMGCTVEWQPDSVTVWRDPATPLVGIDIDMADISDLVPTVAVVAACATTPTRIRGVGFIRGKESDRLGDLARELTQAGVRIAETDDGLAVEPSADRLRPAALGTHHDHRLAMAFGVLGRVVPIEVDDPDVVSKSWPAFWTMLDGLQ
ncbi:MAG TPA: 3-phosphoshikimate 1-carboxyvinyltransferase [Ilumatobacter sp.]|nr:3-phosphoshikimate 1-carboxyvinyltransferase [Ilumatobacter sp.]